MDEENPKTMEAKSLDPEKDQQQKRIVPVTVWQLNLYQKLVLYFAKYVLETAPAYSGWFGNVVLIVQRVYLSLCEISEVNLLQTTTF